MTKVLITTSLLDDLADAIAVKSGENTPMTIAEMTDAVEGISTGTDTSDANATASDIRSGKSGYVNGTKVNGSLTSRDSTSLSASGDTVTVPAGIYDTQATKAVSAGTAGTPSATKGTVSNHSVTVTPSVTNTAGYISGGTKTGTGVTVSASELISFSTIRTGSGAPSSSLGVDGDIYIQTS